MVDLSNQVTPDLLFVSDIRIAECIDSEINKSIQQQQLDHSHFILAQCDKDSLAENANLKKELVVSENLVECSYINSFNDGKMDQSVMKCESPQPQSSCNRRSKNYI